MRITEIDRILGHRPVRAAVLALAVVGAAYLLAAKLRPEAMTAFFVRNQARAEAVPTLLAALAGVGAALTGFYLLFRRAVLAGRTDRDRVLLAYLPFALLVPAAAVAGWVPLNYHLGLMLLRYALAAFAALLVGLFFNASGNRARADRIAGTWTRSGALWAGAYFALLTALCVLEHLAVRTHGYDLGFFDQVIWQFSRFSFPLRLSPTGDVLNTSMHFSPVLLLLAPFYWVWPNPIVLLLAQAGLLALGGWLVIVIARQRVRSPLWVFVAAISYFAFPYLWQANRFDFHETAFVTPIVFGLFLALERRGVLAATALAAGYLGCREDSFIYLTGWMLIRGLGIWIRGGDRRDLLLAGGLGAAGLLYGAWVMTAVAPALLLDPVSRQGLNLSWFGNLGATIPEIASTLSLNFPYLLRTLFSDDRYIYLGRLLATAGFVPLLAPGALLAAGLPISVLVFSRHPDFFQFGHQYPLLFLPFFFLACVLGLRRLESWLAPERRAAWRLPAAVFLVALALVNFRARDLRPSWPGRHALQVAEAASRIPPAAKLSAQGDLIPHVSQRPVIYHFPVVGDAEYIFLDAEGNCWPLAREAFEARLEALRRSPEFESVEVPAGYALFKRRSPVHGLTP